MANLTTYLDIVLLILSVVLTVLVLVQMRNAGLGGVFGGSDSGGVQHTKRGIDRLLFLSTVGVSIVFGLVALFEVLFSSPLKGG